MLKRELNRVIQEVDNSVRTDIPASSVERRKDYQSNFSLKSTFFTSYSSQHFVVKSLHRKHWNVLRNDRALDQLPPKTPAVIFRGVPPLRLQVAPNIIDPLIKSSCFHQMKGLYPCRKCVVCQTNCFKDRSTHHSSLMLFLKLMRLTIF